jgi:endoglucanase
MKRVLWILSAFCLLFVVVGCMENDTVELDETERETGIIVETPEQPANDPGNEDFEDTELSGEDGSESTTESENPPEPPAYLSPVEITATEWVAAIRMGWSLGNTLDAHGNRDGFPLLGGGIYANTTVTELETGWNRPVTAKAHFTALKDAGFNAIRIPVTWYKACDADLNIREDWMARVKEVVGYAVENDMYIILNTHHDDVLFMLSDDEIEESKRNIEKIWEQIADAFKDHGLKLAFEGLNEPRTIGSPAEWRGGTEEERNNLNTLNQVFVDTVRRTGGNNAERVLLVPTYAASGNETAQRGFVLPDDPVEDRLIVSIHYYEPWSFALRTGDGSVTTWDINNRDDTVMITRAIDLAHELFVSNGIPVIIGEMGAINRDNLEARVAWAEFYTSYAISKDIPCFWWDNGSYWVLRRLDWGWEQTFGLLDRDNIEIAHQDIVDALMRGTVPRG